MNDELFKLGAWTLQKDTINRQPIASIRHQCGESQGSTGNTIWFHGKKSITTCYCGARVPDEIQGLCVLFNLEWVQETDLNA